MFGSEGEVKMVTFLSTLTIWNGKMQANTCSPSPQSQQRATGLV